VGKHIEAAGNQVVIQIDSGLIRRRPKVARLYGSVAPATGHSAP
jgi:hypothetical protein